MIKEYRIRKLKEYIAKADAEMDAINILLEGASSIPGYYAKRFILAKEKKAVFESRLKGVED